MIRRFSIVECPWCKETFNWKENDGVVFVWRKNNEVVCNDILFNVP